jgi:hypothetical protein
MAKFQYLIPLQAALQLTARLTVLLPKGRTRITLANVLGNDVSLNCSFRIHLTYAAGLIRTSTVCPRRTAALLSMCRPWRGNSRVTRKGYAYFIFYPCSL